MWSVLLAFYETLKSNLCCWATSECDFELNHSHSDDRKHHMDTPNIFDYATKELSQDAVICWLVACAKEATGVYQERGLEFISALWTHGRNSSEEPCVITNVESPSRQYKNIDVYFQATINDKVVSFVIEDKTDTLMRSGQMQRYINSIRGDSKPEDEILGIFFKTGYVYDEEMEQAETNNFPVFNALDMQKFLKQKPISDDHEILRQYRRHLESKIKDRESKEKRWDLDSDFVQWKFLKSLRDHLEDRRDEWNRYLDESFREMHKADWIWNGLARWKNTGGGAWTQYRFSKYLFWRLDAGYPLRLRVSTQEAENIANGFNAEIWGTWIQAFKEVQEAYELPARKFQRRMRHGNNLVSEGTVGTIDLKEFLQSESAESVLERLVRFHMSFLRRLQEMSHN